MEPPSDRSPKLRAKRKHQADEIRLVRACIAGKPGALEALFVRYSPSIASGVKKALQERSGIHISADAKDLRQQVSYEITRDPNRRLGPCIRKRRRLGPHLRSISHFIALKAMGCTEIRWPPATTELDNQEPESVPEIDEEISERMAMLLPYLNCLDEESRLIVEALCGLPPFNHEHTIAEIAARFGCSRATAYRRLQYAIDKLQKFFEREDE